MKNGRFDPQQFGPAPSLVLLHLIAQGRGDGLARLRQFSLARQSVGKNAEIQADAPEKAALDQRVDRLPHLADSALSPRRS